MKDMGMNTDITKITATIKIYESDRPLFKLLVQ